MYLGSYSKDGINKDGKIIIPTIEKILKLLVDQKNGAKVSAVSESIIRVFKVFKENPKKLKEKWSSSISEENDCIYCLNKNHNYFSY